MCVCLYVCVCANYRKSFTMLKRKTRIIFLQQQKRKLESLKLNSGRKIKSEAMGSTLLEKWKRKRTPSRPGLEPLSSADTTDALSLEVPGPVHVQMSSTVPSHDSTSSSEASSQCPLTVLVWLLQSPLTVPAR